MARIRSIHPGQWTDEEFVSCSPLARLVAIGIRNEADDNGIFKFKPIGLKLRLLPADNCDMPALLNELIETNQIMVFEVEGKRYGMIKNFHKFQSPKKPTFYYPVPAGGLPAGYQLHSDYKPKSSIPVPNQFRTSSELSIQREEDRKKEESSTNVLLVASDADNPCRDEGILAEKPKTQILKPDKPKLVPPPCPYQQIVDLYHEILPMMPQVKKLTEKRRRQIKARWLENPKWQNLETWKVFFSRVSESNFLTGNTRPSYGRSVPFLADLEWLTKESNFVKVCEAKYEDEQPRQYAS